MCDPQGLSILAVQRRPSGKGKWMRWTQVCPSTVHGFGLFACRTFHSGDYIGTYEGLEIDPTPACVQSYESDMVLKLRCGRVVDGQYGRAGLVQRANHDGKNPNAEVLEDGQMVALREIANGQEILWNYGTDFWRKGGRTKAKRFRWTRTKTKSPVSSWSDAALQVWRLTMVAGSHGKKVMAVQHRPTGHDQWLRWTQVRPSTVHGLGLFADRAFCTGDLIGIYDGLELDPASIRAYESDMMVKLATGRVVDGRYGKAGLVQFANYNSSHPNAQMLVNGSMLALRPILDGEEILWDPKGLLPQRNRRLLGGRLGDSRFVVLTTV
eukprot:gnl/TRDRNA2_/TRDRNA2_135237_c1_seq1.p1 gnl/TRDRNA2_/TRDRNA2_135237_c1~~gnl/TRDRNA2_/TRDRNA2_135237_c1_seq1.p1  ORF type:complete len:342 (+),score=29.43 gnl/TRDRNA2_/TRDRNA2_135237_c1_seq1:56-1027(+)